MQRLRSHRDFVQVLKRRRKVTDKNIVVHYLVRDDAFVGAANGGAGTADGTDSGNVSGAGHADTRRLGLAVSKAVGNAVVRNSVKRRFRALARGHERTLPEYCDIVMRAKPSAADASFQALDEQVSRLFGDIAAKCKREAAKAAALRVAGQEQRVESDQSNLDESDDSVEYNDDVTLAGEENTGAETADDTDIDIVSDSSDAPTAEIPVVTMTALHERHRDGFDTVSSVSA